MTYEIQDFAREYAEMSNDEILRLAAAPQELVEGAKTALQAEMSRRGLNAADIDTARLEEERRQEQVERESANRLLRLNWRGIGFQRFCKWDRIYDADSRIEEFTTTRFFILFQLPLVPVATYRARRRKGIFQRTEVMEKLP